MFLALRSGVSCQKSVHTVCTTLSTPAFSGGGLRPVTSDPVNHVSLFLSSSLLLFFLLISHFSLLPTQPHSLVSNDGNVFELVMLEGTVQINFMGAQYNIPIEIFIPGNYPTTAPIAYVRPTPSMEVKPGHSLIDANGNVVRLPYLCGWQPMSSLHELCLQLSSLFSAEPPLFSKSVGGHGSASSSSSSSLSSSSPASSSSSAAAAAAAAASVAESRKQLLIRQVTEKLQQELDKSFTKLLSEQEELEGSYERLQHNRALVEDKILSGRRDASRMKTLALDLRNEKMPMLEKWSAELPTVEEQNRDFRSYMFAYDELSKQLIRLMADERAHEDALKCLEEAFEKRHIPLDAFLLETRDLASAQFIAKQHLVKIASVLRRV